MIIFQAGILTLLCLAWMPQTTVKAACSTGDVTAKALTTAQNTYSFVRLSDDGGGTANRHYLNTDAAFWYDIGTDCALYTWSYCKVYYAASSSQVSTSLMNVGATTGIAYARTDVTAYASNNYRLRCRFNNYEYVYSENFAVSVTCPACSDASITLTYPTTSGYTIGANSYTSTVGTAYTDNIWKFTTSDTTCCAVTSYHIYEDSAMTTAHSTMTITNPSSNYFRINYTPSTVGTTNYWLAVNVQGTYKPVEYSGNAQFSVVASCGSSYGSITEGAFATGLARTQYVPKNDVALTYYQLPSYTVGYGCTISRMRIGYGSNCWLNTHAWFNEPTETSAGSGIWRTTTVNINQAVSRSFTVKVELEGGYSAIFSSCNVGMHRIYQGCQSSIVTWTQSGSLVTSITGNLVHATDGPYTYTYILPTIFPAYCTVTRQINNLSPSGSATYDGSTTVTFTPAQVRNTITFRIKNTDEENNIHYSSTITWQAATCGVSSTVLTQPASINALTETYNIDGSTQHGFDFAYFTSSQSLCPVSSYALYDSTGSTLYTTLDLIDDSSTKNTAKLKSSQVSTKASYSFKLKVTVLDSVKTAWVAVGGNEVFTLNIVCGPSSTTVSEGAFGGAFTATQLIAKTSSAQFTLPAYASSLASQCPILTYLTSSTTGSLTAGTTGMNNPAADGSIVVPTNTAIDYEYSFYIQVAAEGGNTIYSTQFTLKVGCTSSLGATFNNANTAHFVRDTATNKISQSLPTLDRSYCSVASVALSDIVIDGVPSTTALFIDNTCAQPCTTISYLSTAATQSITYKLIYTIDSTLSVSYTTSSLSTALTCTTYSTDITTSLTNQNITFYQDSTDTTLTVKEFTCSNPTCCPTALTYTLTTAKALPLSSNLYTGLPSTLPSTVPVTAVGTYPFYIHATNEYGSYMFTDLVYVNVVYNCKDNEVFYVSETEPDDAYVATYNNAIAKWWDIDGRYRLHFEAYTEKLSNFSIDFSQRFKKRSFDDWNGCEFSQYRIDDVVEDYSMISVNASFSDLFTFDTTTGIFAIKDFNTPYSSYMVYVSAYNGVVWSDHKKFGYLAKFTFVNSNIVLPDSAPFFETAPETINLVTSKYSNETVEYKLPKIIDMNDGNTWAITLGTLENYVIFARSSSTFKFDQSMLAPKMSGTTEKITITLVDNTKKYNEYELSVVIEDPYAFVGEVEEDDTFVFDWEKKDPYTNCSAKISSISKFGELTISFYNQANATKPRGKPNPGSEPFSKDTSKKRKNSRSRGSQQQSQKSGFKGSQDKKTSSKKAYDGKTKTTKATQSYSQAKTTVQGKSSYVATKTSYTNSKDTSSSTKESGNGYGKLRNLKGQQTDQDEEEEAQGPVPNWESTEIEPVNLADVNQSSVKIYLEGGNGRFEYEEFDPSSINFTWNATKQDEDSVTIKLNFTSPMSISTEAVQDYIVVEIQPEFAKLFKSKSLNQELNINFLKMRKKLPKQLPMTAATVALDEGSKSLESILKFILIVVFALSMELPGAMVYMIINLRTLQMILHLPLVKVIVPGNVSMFFQTMIPIAMFDIFETSYTTEVLLDFSEQQQEQFQEERFDQMTDLGYESNSAMLNLGSLAIFTILYFVKLVLFGLFYGCMSLWERSRQNQATFSSQEQTWESWDRSTKRWTRFVDFRKKWKKKLVWGEIIAILIEACFEFLIAGYLQCQHPLIDRSGEIASTIVGFTCLFLVIIVMPAILIHILRQDKERLQEEEFSGRFGMFYEGIRIHNKWMTAYYLFYCIRRVLFCFVAFFVTHGTIQIIMLQYLNMFMVMYVASTRPHQNPLINKIDVVNECFITITTYWMIFFTPYIGENSGQYNFGWCLVCFVIFVTVFNMVFVFYFGRKTIRLFYTKYNLQWIHIYKPRWLKFKEYWFDPIPLDQFEQIKHEREVGVWTEAENKIIQNNAAPEGQEPHTLDEQTLDNMLPIASLNPETIDTSISADDQSPYQYSSYATEGNNMPKIQNVKKKTKFGSLKNLVWRPKTVLGKQADISVIKEQEHDDSRVHTEEEVSTDNYFPSKTMRLNPSEFLPTNQDDTNQKVQFVDFKSSTQPVKCLAEQEVHQDPGIHFKPAQESSDESSQHSEPEESHGEYTQIQPQMRSQFEDVQGYDKLIYDKIVALNEQKLDAVECEDFDSAKNLKVQIEQLKLLGNKLLVLQQDKNMAVDNEDYALAKQLKVKIDKIKDAANQLDLLEQDLVDLNENLSQQNSRKQVSTQGKDDQVVQAYARSQLDSKSKHNPLQSSLETLKQSTPLPQTFDIELQSPVRIGEKKKSQAPKLKDSLDDQIADVMIEEEGQFKSKRISKTSVDVDLGEDQKVETKEDLDNWFLQQIAQVSDDEEEEKHDGEVESRNSKALEDEILKLTQQDEIEAVRQSNSKPLQESNQEQEVTNNPIDVTTLEVELPPQTLEAAPQTPEAALRPQTAASAIESVATMHAQIYSAIKKPPPEKLESDTIVPAPEKEEPTPPPEVETPQPISPQADKPVPSPEKPLTITTSPPPAKEKPKRNFDDDIARMLAQAQTQHNEDDDELQSELDPNYEETNQNVDPEDFKDYLSR